jgi:exportin-5
LAQVPGGLDLAGFIKLIGADRVGEYIRIIPKVRTDIERHGVNAQQYDSTVLDDEGLTLKRTLKQLHRWSWPLRELSSLIDTQQRHSNAKSRGEWQTHQISQINRWSTHIHTFIPGLFRIIACLQGFCNPLNAGGMPFGIQDIGAMVDMGGWDEAAGNTSSDEGSNEKTIRTLVKRLQKNVRNARDHAYVPCDLVNDRFGVLGSLSRLGNVFYAIPDIANLLLESLFGEIQGMGILSWRNLVDDAIRPLVINCPHEYWPTFLPALIPPLLMWLVEHTEWDALNQIESGKIANGDGTVQDEETEVSKEAVLRFLFEGLVGLCTDLVSPMTRGDTAIVVNSKEMAFAARESEMRNVALRKKIQLRAFVLERSVWSLELIDFRTLWRHI